MRKAIILFAVVCAALIAFGSIADADTPTPPPTAIVITATPMPQVIIVTATPSAPPEPKTFWSENGKTIIGALISLIFGGILVWLLRPAFEKLGSALAEWLLAKIRLYVRLSHDLRCISPGQYQHAAHQMDEIGRLIGGWKRKMAKQQGKARQERGAALA